MIDDTAANMKAAQARAGRVRPASPSSPQPDYEGVRRQFDEFLNRGYTRQGQEVHNRPYGQSREPDYVRNPPPRDDAAYRRAMENRPQPVDRTPRRYVHETDIGNVESIRRSGIRPGNRFGHEAVWANEGTAAGRTVPAGRALIEFEADPARIKLRGTTPGSKAAGFAGGPIEPSAIKGGYGPAGRLFDAGSSVLGIAGLVNNLSSMFGGPFIQTPADWILNDVIAQNYNGGIMDPYRNYKGPGYNPATGTVSA